jgi:hypothetical protein
MKESITSTATIIQLNSTFINVIVLQHKASYETSTKYTEPTEPICKTHQYRANFINSTEYTKLTESVI